MSIFQGLFSTDFMAHRLCLRWAELIWIHAGSDAIIALSYFLIPLSLVMLTRKRRDLQFPWLFILFAAFILSCGATHALSIVTLWTPIYRFEGLIKIVTALASLPTAVLLIRMVPVIAAIPSPEQWRRANEDLQAQIRERENVENSMRLLNAGLERRVEGRTLELQKKNRQLEELIRAWDLSCGFVRRLDGTITFWCSGSEQLYGWTKGQAVGRKSHDLLRTQFPEALPDIEAELLRNGSWSGVLRHQTASGWERHVATRWVLERDAADMPVSVTEVNTDISDRIRAEETRARLAAIVESSDDAIISSGLDGNITSWNKGAERLFGFTAGEAIGQPVSLIGIPEHSGEIPTILERIRSNEVAPHYEAQRRRKDGSFVTVSLTVSAIRDQHGRMVGSSKIARDITENKAAAERNEILMRRLESVREEERAHLAREIHDVLGQTLTIIKMDIAVAQRRMAADQTRASEKLQEASSHVDQTIRSLRRLANELRPPLLDTVGLAAALRNHAKEVEERTGIHVSFVENSTIPSLTPDQTITVFRVAQESLTNVIRHSQATDASVALCVQPQCLELIVSDNGKGFSPADAQYRHSLGLLGMRERARLVSGELSVASRVGAGTQITFHVPLPEPMEKRLGVQPMPAAEGIAGSLI